MNKENVFELFKPITIFINDRRLTEREKVELLGIVPYKKKIRKLISKGYLFDGALWLLRKKLKLKQSRRWDRINNEIVNDIILDFMNEHGFRGANKIRLEDASRKINLELSSSNTKGIELIKNTINLYYETVLINQYKISADKIKNKIVIDGGSNLGEFAIYCARLGAKKVYAFEPVSGTYEIMKKQIELNRLQGKVIPVKMALGDKNEDAKIGFSFVGDGGANIGLDKRDNYEVISVVKLDDFIKKGEKVGFIKLDVEGYEENALRGASKIIKRDKPVLAFSAYHKPTDRDILPKVVRSIRPDYRIRLLRGIEEDFYCE